MNLEDVIDPEAVNSVHSLQQDEWSLSKPTFGEEGQLEVVGWSGRNRSGAKYYVLECIKCSQDSELFGDSYFKCLKSSLLSGSIPCGCSGYRKWSKEEYEILCTRKAKEMNYKFLGFNGEWKGGKTKIRMFCEGHGEWNSGDIAHLNNHSKGCPTCGAERTTESRVKPDNVMIKSFFDSGSFRPDTKFWRSERTTSRGWKPYWYIFCPECGEVSEGQAGDIQRGQKSCACSKYRQQQAYINWLVDDHENAVAIKFGIARNSKKRVKDQARHSTYTLKQHAVYTFPSVQQCKQAERECKKELETGVVLKRDMPDGWTETTWSYNIGKVVDIYKRNGGVMV